VSRLPYKEDELPPLSESEREALERLDMTPILGTVEERLRLAMHTALKFMRERNLARADAKFAWGECEKIRTDIGEFQRQDDEQRQEIERLRGAITAGGFDLAPCRLCGRTIVCVPDGIALCESCVKKEE